MAKELIMVMGTQRSGTNALFGSLASDKRVVPFNESIDNRIYHNYRLRSLSDFGDVVDTAAGPVLLKPICETLYRTIEDVIKEYRGYDLRIVWIYRDPVNVFYSMHQEGWIPFDEIGNDGHIKQWNRRNRMASETCQRHPDLMAIVRYEDVLTDLKVFSRLRDWLRLESRPCFRLDSERGRRQVPIAVQREIDEGTTQVLKALDAARTFRPGIISHLRLRLAKIFGPNGRVARAARQRGSNLIEPRWRDLNPQSQPVAPSELSGLRFWLECPQNLQKTGKLIHDLSEKGPDHLSAKHPMDGLYYLSPSLNGRPALHFPAEKVEARGEPPHGILEFGAGQNWSFMFDGGSFTVLTVLKPSVPGTALWLQPRSLLMRIGATVASGPSFVLQWRSDLRAAEGILTSEASQTEPLIASTPPGTHPHEQWRIIAVQYSGNGAQSLVSFANGISGQSVRNQRDFEEPKRTHHSIIEIGGTKRETDSLFFGSIAEIIIFGPALGDHQLDGVTLYLKEKYQLN